MSYTAPLNDMRFVLEEVASREPLALEPTLHVGHGQQDRVDLTGADLRLELLQLHGR